MAQVPKGILAGGVLPLKIYIYVRDDPFERPPGIVLVQHQIGRTVRWLGRARLARIFG